MSKSLLEMSLEELWKLFPIYLIKHQDKWSTWYQEEVTILESILPAQYNVRINHIGSTAIKGIWAKPIVDMLIEVPNKNAMMEIKELLTINKYICMADHKNRVVFNKGYTEKGFAEKVYHIHIRYINDNDEIYFRDYLNAYPKIAKEYELLKISLWKKYKYNRDKYTEGKTEFVTKYTKRAKELYLSK